MAASRERRAPRAAIVGAAAVLLVAGAWMFPLFRVVPLKSGDTAIADAPAVEAYNAAAVAAQLWSGELRAAAERAADAAVVARAIRADPSAARQQHARAAGLGTAYYFVRGQGKVVSRDRNTLRLALDGSVPAIVALRIGPVFGNTVRDGCGLLDVNQAPGLQEFNTLAAELNTLVESRVLPALREKADVGATVTFTGCAEAPETAAGPDEPQLVIVPVAAEVRP